MARIVKKPEERRLEIINSAQRLFLERDYESTTLQDVMRELQIAKGTIYHYFKSKDELLEAVVEKMTVEYIDTVKSALVKEDGTAIKRLRILILAGNISEKSSSTLEQLHRPGNVLLHTRLLAVVTSRLAPFYAKIIQQGNMEGIFKADYPLETAEFLLAGIQFLTDKGFYPWDKETLNRRYRSLSHLIETQLGADKGTLNFLFSDLDTLFREIEK